MDPDNILGNRITSKPVIEESKQPSDKDSPAVKLAPTDQNQSHQIQDLTTMAGTATQRDTQLTQNRASDINPSAEEPSSPQINPGSPSFVPYQINSLSTISTRHKKSVCEQNQDEDDEYIDDQIETFLTEQSYTENHIPLSLNKIPQIQQDQQTLNTSTFQAKQFSTNDTFNQTMSQSRVSISQSQKNIVMNYDYVEKLRRLDQIRGFQQLASYFCIVGMHDKDILNTLMTVKEMIYCEYGLNCFQLDHLVNNSGILSANRPYFCQTGQKCCKCDQTFQVPTFQPSLISRLPSVNRCKFHLPVNFVDFVYPKGLRVLSKYEVNQRKLNNTKAPSSIQDFVPMMASFESFIEKDNLMQREIILTSQCGQIYFVTCYEYFIDLAQIDSEFHKCGYLDKYAKSHDPNASIISSVKIPQDRYFLSFNMCIISLKSHKHQFLKILDRLHKKFTDEKAFTHLTLEQVVNRIVFGIRCPDIQFNSVSITIENGHQLQYPYGGKQEMFKTVQVSLSDETVDTEMVYFKNHNEFEQHNFQFENVWYLLEHLNPTIILTLFRRLIFGTCNIMISKDRVKLQRCIQGIIELFYPLTCDVIAIPNLPLSLLEYVSICSKSLIGVVFEETEGDQYTRKNELEQTKLYDILQDNSCMIDIDKNQPEQKPKQLIAFNAKGNLVDGQGSQKLLYQNSQSYFQKTNEQTYQNFSNNNEMRKQFMNQSVDIPKHFVVQITAAIKKAQVCLHQRNQFIEKAKKLEKALKIKEPNHNNQQDKSQSQQQNKSLGSSGSGDKKNKEPIQEDVQKLKRELFHIQQQMYLKVYQVKLEFYRLTTMIIQTFTDEKALNVGGQNQGANFKGAKSSSGHMSVFLNWYPRQDIHQLINKKHLKEQAKLDGQFDSFYRRALQNQTIQNFIEQKYFPSSLEQNIRQFHALKNVQMFDLSPFIEGEKVGQRPLKRKQKKRQQKEKSDQVFHDIVKRAYTPKSPVRLFEEVVEGFPNDPQALIDIRREEEADRIQLRSAFNSESQASVKSSVFNREQKEYFPRKLDDAAAIEDFTSPNTYFQFESLWQDNSQNEFNGMFDGFQEAKKVLDQLSVVKPNKYRMTNFYEDLHPRDNIVITWIFVFLGSLEYQFSNLDKTGANQFCESLETERKKVQLEKLLAKQLTQTLKSLIYNKYSQSFEFSPKSHLLSVLFECTHKYYYMHQALIDLVYQDIDQRQGFSNHAQNVAVSDSFSIYQLHWEGRQHIDESEQHSTDFERAEAQTKKDLNKTFQAEWTYSPSRIQILRKLALLDQAEVDQQIQIRETQYKEYFANTNFGNSFADLDHKKKDKASLFKQIISKISPQKRKKRQMEKQNQSRMGQLEREQIQIEEELGTYLECKQIMEVQENFERQSQVHQLQSSQRLSYALSAQEELIESQKEYSYVSRARSFWSIDQIKNSTEVESPPQDNQKSESPLLSETYDQFATILEIQDQKCLDCNSEVVGISVMMDNTKCRNCMKKDYIKRKNGSSKFTANLCVKVHSKIHKVTREIQTVKLMHPKKLRSESEIMLMMGQDQSLIHSIDLSILSQDSDPNEQSYYWSLIFWFQQAKLPVQWLAPYTQDLVKISVQNEFTQKGQMMPSNLDPQIKQASEVFFMKAQSIFYTQNSRYDEINSTQQQLSAAQVAQLKLDAKKKLAQKTSEMTKKQCQDKAAEVKKLSRHRRQMNKLKSSINY